SRCAGGERPAPPCRPPCSRPGSRRPASARPDCPELSSAARLGDPTVVVLLPSSLRLEMLGSSLATDGTAISRGKQSICQHWDRSDYRCEDARHREALKIMRCKPVCNFYRVQLTRSDIN